MGARDTSSDPAEQHARIAYLTNQYPTVSHTFIRREIAAVEGQGLSVERFSLRGWNSDLVDERDLIERERTQYTLKDGLLSLVSALFGTMFRRPTSFIRALRAALSMSHNSLRPLPYHIAYLGHACRLLRWLDLANITHLHVHFGTNSAEVALLVRMLGGPPYSFTVHGMDEADDAARLHLDKKAAHAKFIVAISSYTRAQLWRVIKLNDWSKVKLIYCGLQDESFSNQSIPVPEKQQLLCIGRFSVEKGHRILLEAFSSIVKKHPDCQLVLAGDGELRPEVERWIAELGLTNNVRLTGWVSGDAVCRLIETSKIIVQPSLQEGLPVVIMEAMARRRPVLSTFVAGIPELVIDGETGWLVPAGDVEQLCHMLEHCLSLPLSELQRMGEAAFAYVREQHSSEREAKKLVEQFLAT